MFQYTALGNTKLLGVTGSLEDINRIVQNALLGQVPPTLRYVHAYIENNVLFFNACLTDDATEEHLVAVSLVVAEIVADLDSSIQLVESIEINSTAPWKIGNGSNLMFLRYGELSDI